MEQELNIAYDQKLTREVWQRVAQSLPPLEAPAADTSSCGIAAPPPEDSAATDSGALKCRHGTRS